LGHIEMRRTLTIFLFACLSPIAYSGECLLDDRKWINEELPSLTSWSRIYASFKTNVPGCDDGIFGEGYTEAVAKMLSEKWQLLTELKALTDNDPRFRLFVLKHVDASADPDDLKRIYKNATQSCKKEYSELCTALASAAQKAIQEL